MHYCSREKRAKLKRAEQIALQGKTMLILNLIIQNATIAWYCLQYRLIGIRKKIENCFELGSCGSEKKSRQKRIESSNICI